MCGITGIINGEQERIEIITASLFHRGPDSGSTFKSQKVSFGHRRLSIIDLTDEASQPFSYTHEGRVYKLIFNGELYNYIEIKQELASLGYSFRTTSDTEVLVASYIQWQERCLEKFNGMWAFAILDVSNQKIFCARDRLGVKPFYYFHRGSTFVFASEVKAIHGYLKAKSEPLSINTKGVQLYFSLGFIPSPYTVYNDVHKLPAGHILEYDLRRTHFFIREFYSPFVSTIRSNAPSLDELDFLINDAVKLRLRSDVPVGAFLSGGIDSTGVVSSMLRFCDPNNLHTFSIGFDGKLDESPYIYKARDYFKINHHHHSFFTRSDFENYNANYYEAFDEPFADYSGFASLMVNQRAKEFTTVVLSGDGGDELFGGYDIYNKGLYVDLISRYLPLAVRKGVYKTLQRTGTSGLLRVVREGLSQSLQPKNHFVKTYLASERYNPEVLAEWSIPRLSRALQFHDNQLVEALRSFDQVYNTLPDKYLTKVDRSSMQYGVEVRSPFLDFRLIDFANRLSTRQKVGIGKNKIFLKEYFKGKIPDEIIYRPKHGFTPPLVEWVASSKDTDIYDLNIIDGLSPDISAFYREKIFTNEAISFSKEYMIRLLIFNKWYKEWNNGANNWN